MTTPDPFGAQEAQAAPVAVAPPQDPWNAPTTAVAATASVAAPQSHAKIVLTFKANAGHQAPWVVVHADSVAEADAVLDKAFADLLAKTKRVANHFYGEEAAAAPAAAAPAPERPLQPGQPAGSVLPPAWAPASPHPDFVYVTKVSPKTGKPWHAWMPPNGKDDPRDPLFFNPPKY